MARRSREREPEASGGSAAREPKVCASCGRRIEWRAKWADSWAEVKYCSATCRRRGVTATDLRLEQVILELLAAKPGSQPVDTMDAARAVASSAPAGGSRARGATASGSDPTAAQLSEPARRAARRLVARGLVDMVQNGRVVDPSTARGPIQVRRRSH